MDSIRIDRRTVLAGAAAAVLPFHTRAQTPAASPVSDTFPVTVTHALGDTVVPSPPSKVVAASDFTDLDVLLSLDLIPVLYGFTNAWDSGNMPWQVAVADVPSFDAGSEVDLEAIAAATPDLIVGTPLIEEVLPTLQQIAPTIALGWDTPWRDAVRLAGRATGTSGLAETRITETEALIVDAKAQLASIAGRTVMVGFQYGDTFYVWGETVATGILLGELGLTFVPGPEPSLAALSLEQVNLLEDADIVLSVGSDPAGIETQEASPLFQALPAVAAGRYEVLDIVLARSIGDGLSPISLPWGLPQLVDLLLRVADGGGRTLGS